jgi:hypothetical protein
MDYQANYPVEQGTMAQGQETRAFVRFADVMASAPDLERVRRGTTLADNSGAATIQDYGSISSMKLPKGFVADTQPRDAGYLNLGDGDPRLFKSPPNSSLGVWNAELSQSVSGPLREIFQKPGHKLSDDEYFKISSMMSPGPWALDGRNHEISISSVNIGGRNAIVYDSWRTADPRKDGFDAKPQPNDLQTRVVFFPNNSSGKLDVAWMQAPVDKFAASAVEFDKSLQSIKWK